MGIIQHLLAYGCFLFLLCTCDPAPPRASNLGPDAVLLGTSFTDLQLTEKTIRDHLNPLVRAGGNYLRVPEGFTSANNYDLLLKMAEERQVEIGLEVLPRVAMGGPSVTTRIFNHNLVGGQFPVYLKETTQAGLNAIRAARIVERLLPLSELRLDSELVALDNPAQAIGATDGRDNYLIYIPTAGDITINLPDDGQFARRVTVVGHLGTQRSEVLYPPYDRTFTLTSKDDKGGWMIIKREPI